jgi:hypothetical protein
MPTVKARGELRSSAQLVGACFAATLAFGLVLLFAFEPDVQGIDAEELVARSGDARAFLIADLFFPLLYGVLAPIAQLRFGAALAASEGEPRPPRWIVAAAVLLAGAAVFDLTENVLLLSATGSESPGRVDAAHAVAVPKLALFVAGALLALLVLARAISVIRRGETDRSRA